MILQYVDDFLLCAPSEDLISWDITALLNFLATKGYNISKAKAQVCQTSVKYLGLIISEGTRAVGEDRIRPISTYPLPKTLKQLRGFLGITNYCHLWILGNGEIARPLYQLIKDTQIANTHLLLWSPEAEQISPF